MWSLLAELGGIRRALLTVAMLFFVIILLEVDLGHRAAIERHEDWAALVPAVWVPISLFALMALQIAPSLLAAVLAAIAMAISAAVGMIGSGLHMMAAGVDLAHLSRAFSPAVWGGPVSPNWPVSITVASFLGFLAALGGGRDGFPHGLVGVATAAAYVLVAIGIASATVPALLMVSATSLLLSALLLLAVLLGTVANAGLERRTP